MKDISGKWYERKIFGIRVLGVFFRKTTHSFIHSFIHSFTGMCRMRQFLAVLSSFFHSSLLCTLSLHPIPPTSLPSFLTSSCHLFLGLPLNLVVSKFILNAFFGEFCSLPFSVRVQTNTIYLAFCTPASRNKSPLLLSM